MALTTRIKSSVNQCLKPVNLRVDTLTRENREASRLEIIERLGQFEQPVFPLPSSFESMDPAPILDEVCRYSKRFDDFENPSQNDARYTFDNIYFTSPDTEVLYAMIRRTRPTKIIEVGSGNSTKIMRQAILDGRLATRLISIDPSPRTEISRLVDEFYRQPVETLENDDLFRSLTENDILFVDSSHEIKTGNDVVFLYLNVIPSLRPGVLIHIHDVFLPYDYPREWVLEKRWGFSEQYLLQALLTFSDTFELLWAGHFLLKTRPDLQQYFSHLKGRTAKSLWLRKTN